MFKIVLSFALILSASVFAQTVYEYTIPDDSGNISSKYNAVFNNVTTTPADISYINRCYDHSNCDPKKTNEALNYVAAVAVANDYVNNLHDKIKNLKSGKYKDLNEYTCMEEEANPSEEKRKARELMDKYIAYLELLLKEQKINNAEKRLPFLSPAERAQQEQSIASARVNLSDNIAAAKNTFQQAYNTAGTYSRDLVNAVSGEIKEVKHQNTTGLDLYDKIKSQTLEACKKGSGANDALCKAISGKQALAFASGNDPSSEVITKYTDKNCPLLTRLFQENNVKPIMQAVCLGKMNKAYQNQMENGTKGIFDTVGQVNFVQGMCPEMANDPFIQKFNIAASGLGMPGVPSSLDLAAGTGATVPNQNLLAYDPMAGASWFNPSWSPSGSGVNVNNAVNSPSGGSTLKVSPSTATNFYSNLSNGYNGYASQAGNFVAGATDQVNYNKSLNNNIISYTQNKTAYQGYKKSSIDLDRIAGGSSGSQDSVITVRQEITAVQAERQELMNQYMDFAKKGYLNNYWRSFLVNFGSVQEQVDAVTASSTMADIMMMDTVLNYKVIALENQLMKYDGYGYLYDTKQMYAQAGNKINVRSNKLKTPITSSGNYQYKLKPNWRANLKTASKEMLVKAEKAKSNANMYRANIQKLLSKKAPMLSLKGLPSLDMLGYEMKNMEAWKKAGIKNMQIIDKAISTNRAKGMASNPEYKQNEQQASLLRSSMNEMVKSIDTAKEPVNKAYSVLSTLYNEVPRTEELRLVAKQMVEKGL